MIATISARAARVRLHLRLKNLSEKAHDFASCWWAGYSLSAAQDHTRADECLRMHVHFLRRANLLWKKAWQAL